MASKAFLPTATIGATSINLSKFKRLTNIDLLVYSIIPEGCP